MFRSLTFIFLSAILFNFHAEGAQSIPFGPGPGGFVNGVPFGPGPGGTIRIEFGSRPGGQKINGVPLYKLCLRSQ